MAQKVDMFTLSGGLDLQTPSLRKKPGSLINCNNYEASNIGGYSRIQGYERFDGSPSPDESTYYILDFDAGADEPNVDDSVLGATSAATGKIKAVVVESGSWDDNDAAGYIVITKVTGTWVDDENIRDSGDTLTHAVADGEVNEKGADTYDLHKTYLLAAQTEYRNDIFAVIGSGPVRGVWMFNGSVYAFRDNAGATACVMWKSSSIGWVTTDLGGSVTFTGGTTAAPSAGDTVTGGTSTATGILIDVVYTGSWAGGTAEGRFFLHTLTGTFQDSEALNFTAGSATSGASGALTVNTLPAGGRYEFVNHNFYGQVSSTKMYGVNAVGRGFQFDGTGFAFLYTDASELVTDDLPEHVFAHKSHLFLGVQSSVFHSSIGKPLEWDIVSGAGEIATGDRVTGFSNVPGQDLAIFARNRTFILKGKSSSDWELNTHSFETGAIEYSVQNMGEAPKYLDDRGIMSLRTTLQYGDFKAGTLSKSVEPLIQNKQSLLKASLRSREKDQYRLFFTDSTGVTMREMGSRKGYSFTRFQYPDAIECAASVEDTDGTERLFFGSDDGFVYEMDKGNSFDGENIVYSFRLAFNNIGNPRAKKRLFKAVLDVDNTDVPDLNYQVDFSYGEYGIPTSVLLAESTLTGSGGQFDSDDTWGSFFWDGPFVGKAEAYIDGSGVNFSLLVTGSSNFEDVHRVHGANIHYGERGLKY